MTVRDTRRSIATGPPARSGLVELSSSPRLGWWLLALWTVSAVVAGSNVYVRLVDLGLPASWLGEIGLQLPKWLPWTLLTPAIHALSVRYPLEHKRSSFVVAHTILALLVAGYEVLYAAVVEAWRHDGWAGVHWQSVEVWMWRLLPTRLGLYLALYGAVLAGVTAVESRRALRRRELRALRLETLLAEARLESLKTQLQPHFLFNTLHSIATLVDEEPKAARTMIAQLGDLLRASLGQLAHQEVALRDELEMLDLYLQIEQTRFGDRLRIERSIEAAALDAGVPYLVLQPIVENAIRHGIGTFSKAGVVEISARLRDDRLVLTVRDDGPGSPDGAVGEGIGLSNTRARLEQLYPDDHDLAAGNLPDGGFQVTLEVPFHPAPDEAAAERSLAVVPERGVVP